MTVTVLDQDGARLRTEPFPYAHFTYAEKWIDLVLREPVALGRLADGDMRLTFAFDPAAHQQKGIYFHYNEVPSGSHSLRGTAAAGFEELPEREWMIRAYFAPPP